MRRLASVGLGFLILAIAVALCAFRTNAAQPVGADELLRHRLEAAQEGAKLAQSMYQSGLTEFQVVSTWQRRVTSSELALAKSKEQRVAALQKEIERAKTAEEMVDKRVAAGLAPVLDQIAAKFERLDAEASLATEQQ